MDSPTIASTSDGLFGKGTAAVEGKERHRDVGAISGTGRDGEPDLARFDGVMGKNKEEEREEGLRNEQIHS